MTADLWRHTFFDDVVKVRITKIKPRKILFHLDSTKLVPSPSRKRRKHQLAHMSSIII
jgi:hypothetical protein